MMRRIATIGRLPMGLIGTLGLVLAVEKFVARHQDSEFTTIVAQDWKLGGQLSRKVKGCDVLCFGDSLVKYEVVPSVLERRLGLRCVNLAHSMGQAPETYFLLKRAIDSGATPKAIVVDFTEHLLADGPRRNIRHWPEVLDLAEAFDLASNARDGKLFGELATAHIFPTIKDRTEIRASVMGAFRGTRAMDFANLTRFWRNWNANGGAQIIPKLTPQSSIEDWFRKAYPADWHCQAVYAPYIHRFLRLAEEHKIPVIWFIPPYKAEFQALCEANGVDQRFSTMIRRLQDQYPGLIVADGRKARYPHDVYAGDPMHLDFEGANAISEDVADILARVVAGSHRSDRWVLLPDFHTRPIDPRIEHLGQSTEALAAGSRAIRR